MNAMKPGSAQQVFSDWMNLKRSYPLGLPKGVVAALLKSSEQILFGANTGSLNELVSKRKRIISMALDARIPRQVLCGAVKDAWGEDWSQKLNLQEFATPSGSHPLVETISTNELGERMAKIIRDAIEGESPPKGSLN